MGREIMDMPAPAADARLHYGSDALQFGDLRLPPGPGPHPVAIVMHGGFWRARYNLDHIGHLCAALTGAGIATWSLEYRRVGNPGGGWPGTLLDAALGADYVRELAGKHHLDLAKVISIGHSAGGHLALWLAARRKIPQGDALAGANPLALHGAVSLAGVVDLRRGWDLRLGDGAVAELMGGPPEKLAGRYHTASPIELVPLGIKVRLLHGTEDSVVPIEISNNYQKAASRAGDDALMWVLGGADHFAVIDPRSEHWGKVEATVRALLA
ncbi:MAG: alpha/beta hydrolase [Acidobacteriia bacterium]|nr:alpha/beta hydrolase [Terriglobia bacterium]